MDLNHADWRKSSYSGTNGGNCVEVARNLPGVVAVRDSKDPRRPGVSPSPRPTGSVRYRTARWEVQSRLSRDISGRPPFCDVSVRMGETPAHADLMYIHGGLRQRAASLG